MTARISIDAALRDRNLLGAALGNADSWRVWLVALKAAHGQRLDDEELTIFQQIAGGRQPPTKPVKEFWALCGRRSGKSRIASAIAAHAATLEEHRLAPGEIGYVLSISPTVAQANTVFNYAKSFLERSRILRQEIDVDTRTEIRLKDNLAIATHAASFRSTRGRTLLTAILDEVAFFRDETSAQPDIEVYRALKPALETTGGMLVGISTPYRRVGLLHQKHRDHYGVNDDDVLVVSGPSTLFNPTLSASSIAKAIKDDPEAGASEWEATFRSDISSFLDELDVNAAIDLDRPTELPPQPHLTYRAFVDPSGGRHDAMALAIAHSDKNSVVLDVVRYAKPPFDPVSVVNEFSQLLKDYGLSTVTGDNYSAAWCQTAFADNGVKYVLSELPKSRLALEALPLFTRRVVRIPNHARLIKELTLLERRTHVGGRDVVDHGRNGSDDLSNSMFGAMFGLQQPNQQRLRVFAEGLHGQELDPKTGKRIDQSQTRLCERLTWVITDAHGNELSRTKAHELNDGSWLQQLRRN
jgi:hypothetical protein